jgi:hypothetical protein
MAPMLPAAPMAASPATPAPTTRTLAGGTLPAAVTCPVKNRPKLCAASTTARYPAMLAIEDSTSSDWAREIRGTASMASTVIGRVASCTTRSGLSAGEIRLISVAPSRRAAISALSGAFTLSTTSAVQGSPTLAPASVNAESEKLEAAPAPVSTATS